MLGFVAAVGAELATGRTVGQQVAIAPSPIAAVFLLFTVASMIPILKVCAVNNCSLTHHSVRYWSGTSVIQLCTFCDQVGDWATC